MNDKIESDAEMIERLKRIVSGLPSPSDVGRSREMDRRAALERILAAVRRSDR